MAGTLKPYSPESNLRSEAKYTIIALKATSSGSTIDKCGLFNEVAVNEWDTANVFYWYGPSDYLEIEIHSDTVNIWRCGTSSWANSCAPLTVYKLIDGAYVNITSTTDQKVSAISETNWEKTLSNLTKGIYKFVGGSSYRLDSEWYIEDCNGTILYPICTDLANIKLGELYPCKYTSKNTGVLGRFSDLGIDSNVIALASSSTPNGCFYWVYIGDDKYGRKQFIADRNIQHTITWMTLSNDGLITGNPDLFNIRFSYASSSTSLNFYHNFTTVTSSSNVWKQARCNICKTEGQWYYEVLVNQASSNELGVGFCIDSAPLDSYTLNSIYMYLCDGTIWRGESTGGISYGDSYTNGDTIGVLLDFDNDYIRFYKNGVDQGVAFTNINGVTLYPCFELYGTKSATINLGWDDFKYNTTNALPYTYNDQTEIYDYTISLLTNSIWSKYQSYIYYSKTITSWVQDTHADNGMNYRYTRGGGSVLASSYTSANGSSSGIGFRPLLTISIKLSAKLKLSSACSYLQPLYLTGSFTDNVHYTIKLNDITIVNSQSVQKGEQINLSLDIIENGVLNIYYYNNIQERVVSFNVYKKTYPITYVDYNLPSKNFAEALVKISPTSIVLCKYTYNKSYGYMYNTMLYLGFLGLSDNYKGTFIFGLIKESFDISTVSYNTLPTLDQDTYSLTIELTTDMQFELTSLMKKLFSNDYHGIYIQTENVVETLSSDKNNIVIDYIPTLLEYPKLVYNSRCLITWKKVIYSRMNSINVLELWKDTKPDFSTARKIFECDINTTSYLDTDLSYGTTYYKLIIKMKENSSSGEIKFENSSDYTYNKTIITSNKVSLKVVSEAHSYNINFSDTDINDKVTILNPSTGNITDGVFKLKPK